MSEYKAKTPPSPTPKIISQKAVHSQLLQFCTVGKWGVRLLIGQSKFCFLKKRHMEETEDILYFLR